MTGGRRLAALPLPALAGGLAGLAVLLACAAASLVLVGGGGPVAAVAAAAGVGLAASVASAVAAARLAQGLRCLHADALHRLSDPAAPVTSPRTRPLAVRASREVAELARALDALHLRVRVGDELGKRHQRDAETVGAGVFELLSGLVAAEEGARGQLAAELHDTVAQSLMIARGLLTAATPTPELARLSDYVEDAEEQVRAVMARTRPPALRDGDLASAVDHLRADMAARYGLVVHVRWPSHAYPLPLASAITVYRFFQEALLNVVKHADVDDAHVALEVTSDAVVATVRDDGPGFDPDAVRPDRGRHVGLGLLRERARLAGGRLEVLSQVGTGSALVLRLPRGAQVAPVERADPVEETVVPPQLRRQDARR